MTTISEMAMAHRSSVLVPSIRLRSSIYLFFSFGWFDFFIFIFSENVSNKIPFPSCCKYLLCSLLKEREREKKDGDLMWLFHEN